MEHQRDRLKKKEDSVLYKHDVLHHPDLDGGATYFMAVIGKHRRPLQRQVQESVLIQESKAQIRMNSKSEYNSAKIPRIRIEVGEWLEKERELGEMIMKDVESLRSLSGSMGNHATRSAGSGNQQPGGKWKTANAGIDSNATVGSIDKDEVTTMRKTDIDMSKAMKLNNKRNIDDSNNLDGNHTIKSMKTAKRMKMTEYKGNSLITKWFGPLHSK